MHGNLRAPSARADLLRSEIPLLDFGIDEGCLAGILRFLEKAYGWSLMPPWREFLVPISPVLV